MNTTRLSVAAMIISVAGVAMAADAVSATSDVQQAAAVAGPKTREQVREELAQAKASGDYDRMLMWYVDPAPVDPRMAWPRK